MTVTKGPATDAGQPTRSLKGSLGVTAIVFMVVAAASPLTVVGGAAVMFVKSVAASGDPWGPTSSIPDTHFSCDSRRRDLGLRARCV